ncbi:MAG: hypothetical protein ACRC78_10585 [Planktothrix sp.]
MGIFSTVVGMSAPKIWAKAQQRFFKLLPITYYPLPINNESF